MRCGTDPNKPRWMFSFACGNCGGEVGDVNGMSKERKLSLVVLFCLEIP